MPAEFAIFDDEFAIHDDEFVIHGDEFAIHGVLFYKLHAEYVSKCSISAGKKYYL